MCGPAFSIRMTARRATRVSGVVDAVLLDPALNERQKRVLLDVYASFVRENAPADEPAEAPATKRATAKKTPATPRNTTR